VFVLKRTQRTWDRRRTRSSSACRRETSHPTRWSDSVGSFNQQHTHTHREREKERDDMNPLRHWHCAAPRCMMRRSHWPPPLFALDSAPTPSLSLSLSLFWSWSKKRCRKSVSTYCSFLDNSYWLGGQISTKMCPIDETPDTSVQKRRLESCLESL